MILSIVVVIALFIILWNWILLDNLFELLKHFPIQFASPLLDAKSDELRASLDGKRSIMPLEVVFDPLIAGLTSWWSNFISDFVAKHAADKFEHDMYLRNDCLAERPS